jgi:hypothetical protein
MQKFSFNIWFSHVKGELNRLERENGQKETSHLDRDTAQDDYDSGLSPEESAKSFYEDWYLE